MPRKTFLLPAIVLLSLVTHEAIAQNDPCPPQPVYNLVQSKYSGNFIVEFLKSVIGKIGIGGTVELSPEDALHEYPDSARLLMQISVLSTTCKIIYTDPSLSAKDKVVALTDLVARLHLIGADPTPHGDASPSNRVQPAAYHPGIDRQGAQLTAETSVEAILQQLPNKVRWQNDYCRLNPDGTYKRAQECGGDWCYNIIVGTAHGRPAADMLLDQLNTAYPSLAFQLWISQRADTYAVVAAIGLPREEAVKLTEQLRHDYPNLDAKFWRWPKFAAGYDIAWPW